MVSTASSIEEALRRGDELGGGGSILDRVLAGFNTPVPKTPGTTAASAAGGGGGFLNSVFAPLGLGADVIASLTPDPFEGALKTVAKDVFSGEELLNIPGLQLGTGIRTTLERAPKVGGLLGQVFDIGLSPASLIPAAAPARFIGAAARIPLLGRGAKLLLEPLLASPVFSGRVPQFLERLGAETAAGIGAETIGVGAGNLTASNLPENTPYPVQLGIMLSAGLVGAAAGVAGFRFGSGVVKVMEKSLPSAAVTRQAVVDNRMAGLTETQELRIAQLDDEARVRRGEMVTDVGSGVTPKMVFTGPDDDEALSKIVHSLTRQGEENVTTSQALITRNIDTRPDSISASTAGRYMPDQLSRWVENGWVGKNPASRAIAVPAYGYSVAELQRVNVIVDQLEKTMKSAFGENFSLVTVRANADPRVKAQWDRAVQREDNQMGLIIENPNDFNITPDQSAFLDAHNGILLADEALNRPFGIEYDEGPVERYVRHSIQFIDPATGRPLSTGKLDTTLGTPHNEGFQIGAARTFQKARTFKTIVDAMESEGGDAVEKARRLRGALEEERLRETPDEDRLIRLNAIVDGLENSTIDYTVGGRTYADGMASRLAESVHARTEALAINTAKKNGNPKVLKEVKDMFTVANHGNLFKAIHRTSSTLRPAILSLDFSFPAIQGWGAFVMGRGLKTGMDGMNVNMARIAASGDNYSQWLYSNIDRLSDASIKGGVAFGEDVVDIVRFADDDLLETSFEAGLPIKGRESLFDFRETVKDAEGKVITTGGRPVKVAAKGFIKKDPNLIGRAIRGLNTVQFRRMASMWKLETYDHVFGMLKAAQSDEGIANYLANIKGVGLAQRFQLAGIVGLGGKKNLALITDDELATQAGSFVNNLFGGLNRVEKGRSTTQNMVESIFILTPGFTRGTLGIGANLLKGGASGALARDFAVRGIMLAGMVVYGLTTAINGISTAVQGDPQLITPNLTDPSKGDWFDIPLPDGKTIRPLSRFRSLAKLTYDAIDGFTSQGLAGGSKSLTEDTLRWASYRQSALLTSTFGDPIGEIGDNIGLDTGNRFARGFSLRDIAFDPSESVGADFLDLLNSNSPIVLQNVTESIQLNGTNLKALREAAVTVGSEFLGVTAFGPSIMSRSVSERGFDEAVAAGVDKGEARSLANQARPPWQAKDSDGRFIIDGGTREGIVERIAAEMGLDPEVVSRGGRLTERDRKSFIDAVEETQVNAFFEGLDLSNAEYTDSLLGAVAAVESGAIAPSKFSERLTILRLRRAAQKKIVQDNNPAAMVFLDESARKGKQNARDALFSAISAEAFDADFFDISTQTFDFDGRDAHFENLRRVYGPIFDEWQARSDKDKHPLELSRDNAFERMEPYFAIADQMWVATTGGAMGLSERDFDRNLAQDLRQQGIQEGVLQAVLSSIKSNIPAISQARSLTRDAREIMRLLDPQLETDVTTWLGAQSVGF